jgi:hypothetical protein
MRRWVFRLKQFAHHMRALRYIPHYYRALATVRSRDELLKTPYRIRLAWAYAKMAEPYIRVKR